MGNGEPAGSGPARTRKNALGVIIDADESMTTLLGWTRNALIGRRLLDFLSVEEHKAAGIAWLNLLQGDNVTVRLHHQHADGHYVPVLPRRRDLRACRRRPPERAGRG